MSSVFDEPVYHKITPDQAEQIAGTSLELRKLRELTLLATHAFLVKNPFNRFQIAGSKEQVAMTKLLIASKRTHLLMHQKYMNPDIKAIGTPVIYGPGNKTWAGIHSNPIKREYHNGIVR